MQLEDELFSALISEAEPDRRHDFALSAAFDRSKSSSLANNAKLFDIIGKLATLFIVEQRSAGTKALGIAQLHTLLWSGVLDMTYNSIAAALYCWDLVCSTVPSINEVVFSEILNIWRYLTYRGGIVEPGSISTPKPANRPQSELIKGMGFQDLNSTFQSTQITVGLHPEDTETGLAFRGMELKHLLEIQEGILDFVSRRYYPFLARNSNCLKYIIRMVYETISLPLSTAAIREKRGMQVCLKLFILALNMLSAYNTAGDTELPNYMSFRDGTLRFMLRAFSSSYTWRQVGRSTKLDAELTLLQMGRGLCLVEDIDSQIGLGKYTVLQRCRPSTTDISHSGTSLFYLRLDHFITTHTHRKLLTSISDSHAAQFGIDVSGSKVTKYMRILLHLLLSDEYERLFTWNRPTLTDIISLATSV